MQRALLIVLLAFALAACGQQADPQAPVAVVRQFVAGLEARDAEGVLALLPPTAIRRQVAPELRVYLGVVERLAFREPVYELVANDGRAARVKLTAAFEYGLRGGQSGAHPVTVEFDLVNQDGVWYLDTIAWPPIGQEGQ